MKVSIQRFILPLAIVGLIILIMHRPHEELAAPSQPEQPKAKAEVVAAPELPSAVQDPVQSIPPTSTHIEDKKPEKPQQPSTQNLSQKTRVARLIENLKGKKTLWSSADEDYKNAVEELFRKASIVKEGDERPEGVAEVIWVVDNSRSMARIHQNLNSEMDEFVRQLAMRNARFRFHFINTDLQSSSLKLYSDLAAANSNVFVRKFGDIITSDYSGSGREKGIAAAIQAAKDLSNTIPSDAKSWLAIVVVSDEDDESPLAVEAAYSELQELSQFSRIRFYSIVHFPPKGDAGIRYAALSHLTGGFIADVAGDFHAALLKIRAMISADSEAVQ